MEAKATESPTKLRITRTFDATRREVFDALTKPEELSKWFAPSDEFEAYVDRFDTEVGGSYRIEMRHKDGNVHTCIGTIREIKAPERLVYTWRWEGGEMGDTRVTWELRDADEGTELILTHDQFPNEEAKAEHSKGWNGCLARLDRVFA